MSQYSRAEHAIDYYEHPTDYCREPGCNWKQEAEWNQESMSKAERAGIDHWNATHKALAFGPLTAQTGVEGRPVNMPPEILDAAIWQSVVRAGMESEPEDIP